MKKAKVSKYGQWKYPGQDTIIPNANGSITMKGVPYPVLGIDDRGNRKLMMPGGEYQFPGNSVYEIPMMAAGGIVNPCPPGKVPDGKGNCVDDLTTPPIPSSSLYPYYTEQLAKAKANPKITNPDALVGQMIRCKRDGSCKIGEEWTEEEKITKVPPEPGPKEHYTIKDSGNPGHSYLWKYTDDGNSGYNQELIGSVFNRDFLNDEQQVQFDAPGGGTAVVNYDPNIQKVYSDQRDVWQTIEDERGVKQNAQNNLNREQQRIKEENAARELWEKQQREKQNKRIAPPKDVAIPPGGFAMGGELDHGKVAGRSRTKANNKNYVLNQTFYEDGFIDNNSRRTLKGFITGAPKPGEPGAPAKLAMGGAKKVKIKSLPKAQYLGELTPEQRKVYDNRYIYNREHGFDSNESNRSALQDAQYSNTGPIYNFQPFLPDPDSGVRIASGKRFPLEYIDWNTYKPFDEAMYDPDFTESYYRADPELQGKMKDQVESDYTYENYYNSLDDVKAWEKSWYTKRAQLPQFTDVANKRLSLIDNVNMQPITESDFSYMIPGAGAAYTPDKNSVLMPTTSWLRPSAFVHERSHWLDWNAPQNDDMYNGSYFRSYLKPGSIPDPVYNDEDEILTNIIPSEYKLPYGVVDPLRLGENDTNTYSSESEKIIANRPEASDNVRSAKGIKLPFKGKEEVAGSNNINYYYRPTEVRARLNEWRFDHNIDPTKEYTNEEIQKIIDDDIENKNDSNFDFYKIIRGRGDLLKQINDSYVSTGDKENPDEMPKAQRGLRKAQTQGPIEGKITPAMAKQVLGELDYIMNEDAMIKANEEKLKQQRLETAKMWEDYIPEPPKIKKGKTLFGRQYQIVEVDAGPDELGFRKPGEKTKVKTIYYKNGNIAKQKIDNNEKGVDEITWHDKDGNVTAEATAGGYRTFSNGYFDYINNVDYETTKRRNDEVEHISSKNKLDDFLKRAKLNLENMSREGSQPGDSYNTVWPDWENDRFNYTRIKNPDVRKSRAKFQGGGLPNDYQDFLGYSETAPENRRPDSEWQYGNPRQYDHYGMWDALGKPENFNQALEKNPQWQPDPYDNMYHGFSTNPNTGVWLKSHIPGESHPGDTGWMEYKDFMLSNDRNWGGKNQNLVYDPDLQRMRYVDRKKAGGTIKQVRIKSLPKAQITGELSKEKQEALDREFRRQQATAWDPNQLNGAQEVPTDTPVVVKPMTIAPPAKNPPKKSKEQIEKEKAVKQDKKTKNDPTLWLLEHPEYMLDPDGNPVLKSSMEANAPADYLTLQQKALKDEFIKERNEDPLQRSLGSVTNNPQTNAAAERYANTELAAPLLEKNPRDKYATRAEWIESFNPQERAIIQGSNKSYKFNPNVWTTFSRALQTEGNRDSQWQRNLDLTQEEKNAPVTKMDRLGLLAPLAIPAYGAQRLLTGDYENLSDIGSGDTPKPYFGDSGTMRDYYQPQAQAIGNGLWQAALDPLNYIGAGGGNLLGDARLFNLLDGPISKSINEFSALTPNFRAFDPKLQALRNMRGYGAGIGNGVLPGHDDIFRYLAEAERTSGVDRSYLMGLSEDDFLRHRVIDATINNPNNSRYPLSDDLLSRWQLEDARINNRVPLATLPSEIIVPYNMDEVINLARRNASITRPTSITERLFGRISDSFRGLRRVAGDDVPISQVPNNFRNYVASDPGGPMNASLLGKTETKALLKDKSEIDKLEKLSDSEFRDILITPDGRIKFPEKYTGPKQITKVETKDWVEEFNGNLDLLNRIIAENNTSGREYWVTGITEDGVLKFRTAEGRTSSMSTYIKPGKFKGEVQDIADTKYMVDEIPGLQMAGASPIFGDAVRGTGTYKSLNEYLKKMELGRVKSGMNMQSNYSKPLWENAIKKGDAFGFYASPGTVHGIMKKEGGTKKKKPGFQVLTDANGKYVFVKT